MDSCYRAMLKNEENHSQEDLPFELITKTRAYIVLTVIEWTYFKGHPLTRAEMIRYIDQLTPHTS